MTVQKFRTLSIRLTALVALLLLFGFAPQAHADRIDVAEPQSVNPITPRAVDWNIEIWPSATCGGWTVEFDRVSGSSSENWRLKLDGVVFETGTVNSDQIISGFWPSGVDLTSGTHIFRAEIEEGGSWLDRQVTFGPCPAQLSIVKSVNPAGNVATNATLTYQVVVGNPSNVLQTGIVITDSLPAGVSYVGSSTTAVGTASTNTKLVKDTFASQSYSRQDGSDNWSTNWVESNSGDSSASSGRIYNTFAKLGE